MKKSDVIETAKAHIWLREDGILHVEWLPGVDETLEDAQATAAACVQLGGGQRRPALADIRHMKSETRESRDFWASKERSEHFTAAALLISSGVSRVLGNFFLGVAKPGYPTKLFTSEALAIEWLRDYIL